MAPGVRTACLAARAQTRASNSVFDRLSGASSLVCLAVESPLRWHFSAPVRNNPGFDQASMTRLPNFHPPSCFDHSASNCASRSPGRICSMTPGSFSYSPPLPGRRCSSRRRGMTTNGAVGSTAPVRGSMASRTSTISFTAVATARRSGSLVDHVGADRAGRRCGRHRGCLNGCPA